jgi:predicted dehydrogenase
MAKLKVGVIGAGSIGNIHLGGYANAPGLVKISAICDPNPKRASEMGQKYGVGPEHLYPDYKSMLKNENLDAISVCTPNKFHYECAKAAIGAGCHTLIEKPMVLSNSEAKKLRQFASGRNVKTMVAFSHRFFRPNIAMRKALRKNAIGKPFMIRVRYAHSGPYPGWAQTKWFYNRDLAGGGALLDMGIHAIDMCQHLIGPITSVSANIGTLRKKIEVDDNAVLLLDFGPQKCFGYIECGWTSGPGFLGIEVHGDKGHIVSDFFAGATLQRGVTRPNGTTEQVTELLSDEVGSHWVFQMDQWTRYISGKKTEVEIPGLDEGASSLAIALSAQESAKTGRRISLK